MNLLALDTSTDWLSLALHWRGETICRAWQVQQKHAELTLPAIQQLLADAGASLGDLQGLALSIGPGSFTGLRIGCGIVQGLAFGFELPVVGVNTLAALAADIDQPNVLAVLDARMGELYVAGFAQADGVQREILSTMVCKPEALPSLPEGDWWIAGSGLGVQAEAIGARYAAHQTRFDAKAVPHARGVLKLASAAFAAGNAVPAEQLELLYIRNNVALKSADQAKLRAGA